MNFGAFNIFPVSDGYFKLDGGAMFGVVPRVLWEKRTTPDASNRIQMGLWCLLIQTGKLNILVNTGVGNKYSARLNEIYAIQHPPELLTSLAAHNIKPADINMVILTHLHFDHCGGNTIYQDGRLIPTFPNARYLVQKAELANALKPNERTRASYIKENILPLSLQRDPVPGQQLGQIEVIDGDQEITPGLFVHITGGHTKGHQIILIKSAGKTAVYWSDLIPTVAHVDLPYIMSYDLYPEETLNEKRALVEQAVREKWLCFWEHDPKIVCGYIEPDGPDKYKVIAQPCD